MIHPSICHHFLKERTGLSNRRVEGATVEGKQIILLSPIRGFINGGGGMGEAMIMGPRLIDYR